MGLPKLLISLSAAHGRVARLTSKTRERDNALGIAPALTGVAGKGQAQCIRIDLRSNIAIDEPVARQSGDLESIG